MNNQEILDNAPEGATHVLFQSINYIYIKFGVHTESFMYCNHKEGWRLATHVFHSNLRALSDIKRIVELEAENKLLHIELGATQHAFTDYRASYAMKACMMCNSLERVHCYANTERLEAKVAELKDNLANAEHKKCEIERTCSECNKAFILKDVHHNPNLQETTSIFDNCPHCHARNDIWVKISWLSK
jgi:hypothetical protein